MARLLIATMGGLFTIGFGMLFINYRSMFVTLGWILVAIGVISLTYGIVTVISLQRIRTVDVVCPFCRKSTGLTGEPDRDFRCQHCQRMVPIENGRPMSVSTVNCPSCQKTNFYHARVTHLACESCGKDIPISTGDSMPGMPMGGVPVVGAAPAPEQDNGFEPGPFRVVLTGIGAHLDDLADYIKDRHHISTREVDEMLLQLPWVVFNGVSESAAHEAKAAIESRGGSAEVLGG